MKILIYFGMLLAVAPAWLSAQAPDASTFSLSPGDVTEAIINTSGPAQLKVMLAPAKSEELATFTASNLNKQGRIIVAGKLRAEPFIRERMTGPAMELYVRSAEDALATVKALLTSKLKFDQLHKWTDSNGTHYSEQAPVRSSDQIPPTEEISDARTGKLLSELQGSWEVVKATKNGKDSADRSLLQGNWKFQGSELVLHSPQNGIVRFALKLDAKAYPKAFHLTAIEPAHSGSGWMLFSRDTNTLRIAFHDNLQGRPEGFEPRQPRAEPELLVVTLAPKK